MVLSDFFNQVNSAYRGSDDDTPAAGTADRTLWVLTTNRKIREWATDPNTRWRSRFSATYSPGIIASGTQSYNLATTFFAPSDKVIITKTDGNDVEYEIVSPQDRDQVSKAVYISGTNPQVLTFYDEITSDSDIVGGTIYVPSYSIPADIEDDDAAVIPVDDPYWLVYAVAAELAFNDITYEYKNADLQAKANNLWVKMLATNRQGTAGNPRVARYNIMRISGSNR